MDCKRLFIVTLFFIHSLFVLAQNKGGPVQGADTNVVNSLLFLSKNNFGTDPEKAIQYAVQARQLSEKINFEKGKALALKNIGIANYYQGNNILALSYYQKSLLVFQSIKDDNGISNIENNIGAIYMNQGDDTKALAYFLKSLEVAERTGNKLRIVTPMSNIGAIYSRNDSTLDLALSYYLKALPMASELADSNAIGTIAVNVGEIYVTRKNDSMALKYLEKSLAAFHNSENSPFSYNAIGKVYLGQKKYGRSIQYHRHALEIAKKLNGKLDIVQSLQGLGKVYIELKDYAVALNYLKQAEVIAMEINAPLELMRGDSAIAASYADINDYKNAHLYEVKYTAYKDTLYNNEKDKKLARLQFGFDLEKKEGQITLLKKDNELTDLELNRQKLARNALIIGLIMAFILAFFIYRNYRIKVKTNKILDRQKVEIENLLLNILPAEVAHELQTKGHAIPRNYESVSVLFTDFKGFTAIADKMTPTEVVHELSTCFMAFDNIVEKHRLEKIKTIGDSYMCAGGIPTYHEDHVCNMVKAGLEMLSFIEQYNKSRIADGFDVWDIRVGIHVGPVVAGVVGTKKYAYDIWGSTVNIASRMESNGLPGMINISAATYELIKNDFDCNYRGKIHAKNVGEIDMYFVTNKIISVVKKEEAINGPGGDERLQVVV
ncbi:MAG: adenylate/guanylate cyclase domain-containing protein [Ginsengibacter sp.]